MDQNQLDWDMQPDYYEGENEEKKQEPAVSKEEHAAPVPFTEDAKFQKIVADVRLIKEKSAQGKTILQIAEELGFAHEYVSNILLSVQGYPEDDEIAIAHLILFES